MRTGRAFAGIWPSPVRRALAALASAALVLAGTGPVYATDSPVAEPSGPPVAEQTWTMNIYKEAAIRWQNPDPRACTAAAALSMLNLIAYSTREILPLHGGALPYVDFYWQPTTSFASQETVLAYERANDTLLPGEPGSDPHGWRNALNYYGWGSAEAGVYRDRSFGTFTSAAYYAVRALARTNKPVGILAWYGGHAEFITGYVATGSDPRVADDFQVQAVYVTDPYQADGTRNLLVSYSMWRNGPIEFRFAQYWQNESPYRDPIDGQVGNREWYGKWVIEEPTR
jgi:hypothetical protein